MEQNYYELLEVSPDVPFGKLERAYQIARATYRPASTATYSIFTEEENAEILRRIDEAYSVLSDAKLRAEYDARLQRESVARSPRGAPEQPAIDPAEISAPPVREDTRAPQPLDRAEARGAESIRREPAPAYGEHLAARRPAGAGWAEKPDEAIEDAIYDDVLEPEDGIYDGAVLRRIRLSLGIEFEEIAAITKISEVHLESIEDDAYDALPAPVYVRGFVKEIAKALSLDAKHVADSYMARMGERTGGLR